MPTATSTGSDNTVEFAIICSSLFIVSAIGYAIFSWKEFSARESEEDPEAARVMKTLNALMSNTKERDSLRRAHAQTQSRLSKKIPFLHSKSNVQRLPEHRGAGPVRGE
ncbi:hypothetical protein CYMTET_52547 [Cymbomonas tetramitiformis]|uniref:Uncharacterized protein n=1 Tax=Cymbomonas tetramitiformis TaxID=36881 RepID=A0AAE0BJY1_9CHLO|nr:hypothetical protein CYMTET_52547 [Cymbomonas tetramitiformis]